NLVKFKEESPKDCDTVSWWDPYVSTSLLSLNTNDADPTRTATLDAPGLADDKQSDKREFTSVANFKINIPNAINLYRVSNLLDIPVFKALQLGMMDDDASWDDDTVNLVGNVGSGGSEVVSVPDLPIS